MANPFGDASVFQAPEKKHRNTRLTFDPTISASEIVVKLYNAENKKLGPLFVTLDAAAEEQKRKEAKRKNKKPIPVAPPPVHRFYPLDKAPTVLGASLMDSIPNAGPSSIVEPPPRPNSGKAKKGGNATKALSTSGGNEGKKGEEIPSSLPPRPLSRTERRSQLIDEEFGAVLKKRWKQATLEIPVNLATIYAILCRYADENTGMISAVKFTEALAEFDVHDIVLADKLFNLLNVHKTNGINVPVIMLTLNDIINGDLCKERVRQECFELFNVDGKGYIPKAYLDKLKFLKKIEEVAPAIGRPEISTFMVKVLSDTFLAVLVEEEEQYVAKNFKGKGRKKAPALKQNQKSVIPTNMMRIAHLDFPTFCRHMDLSKELAVAFLPIWLHYFSEDGHLQHEILMRRIREEEDVDSEGGGSQSQGGSTNATPR